MKTSYLFLPALLIVAGCGGGVSSHEEAMEESVSIMEDFCDVLDDVKDKKSAEAAKGDLEDIAKRMEELQKQMKELGTPDAEEGEALRKEMGGKLEKVTERMMKNMQRIASDPEVAAALEETMRKMPFGR